MMESSGACDGVDDTPPTSGDRPCRSHAIAIISLLVLVGIFLIATLLPIHMGALAIAAAFVLGILLLPGGFSPEALDEKSEAISDGFPGDLFITLAGVTFLFGIAKNNGTVDWLVHAAVRSVARPGGPDPVGVLRRHGDPDRYRRGGAGRRRDHRARSA